MNEKKEKSLYTVYFKGEIEVEASSEKEAIDYGWHDIIVDIDNIKFDRVEKNE